MSGIAIERYSPALASEWDRFVASARNGSFLFMRPFMDYHSDRFIDHSLVARKGSRIIALLPANIAPDGKVLHSHQGLTYGGWILPPRHVDCSGVLDLFDCWITGCREEGIEAIDYKPLPYIYADMPAGEDIYALWRHGAVMTSCNISTTIRCDANPGFNEMKRRQLVKASRLCAEYEEVVTPQGYAEFHAMLIDCLAVRHEAAPVHSLEELLLLASRFPDNIKLYAVRLGGEMQAGVLLFISPQVTHCQYIASTEEGRRLNLLTPLIHRLISGCSSRYFDFGTSNEDSGLILNRGLYAQKAALGGSGVPYQEFSIKIS